MTGESGAGRPSGFRTGEIALLLLGSGTAALVYQIVWTREFRLIFGGSTSATAAVLAIFTLGLGAGAHFLGRKGDQSANPLRVYALLEAGVAVGALASPGLLALARSVYLNLGGEGVLGPVAGTVLRLALTTLVLAIPTVLMGGTLPAAVAAVGSSADPARLRVAFLYGVNTLGAVLGSLVSTFVTLEHLGTKGTLIAAVGLNVFVAALAFVRSRTFVRDEADLEGVSRAEPHAAHGPPTPRRFVLAAAFVTGFVFFVMELVWYRMLSPILGGTVFTFGLILATVLFGIGLGGAAFWFSGLRTSSVTLRLFAWTCLLEGTLILLPFAAGDRIAVLAALLRDLSAFGFWGAVSGWAVIAGMVCGPASVVAGFQFPLMIALLGRGRASVGADTASAYVWNMVGGILGSLVGGFGAIPLLTAPGVWRLFGLIMIALSVIAAIGSRGPGRGWITGFSLLALLPAFAAGPSAAWRHSQIGVGRSGVEAMTSAPSISEWMSMNRRWVIWEADGVESSVALRVGRGLNFVVNGKIDGHATLDAPTQIMAGVLPAILHRAPRTAMVIGLGTGGTAGWMAAVPAIQRVDVSEMEPRIVDVARQLSAVNERVLSNPKVRIHLGDAREFLQTTPSRYDIVVSEPSNPYRAGIASLFSREYYAQIKKRMNPGGIFVQWLQTNAVDLPSIRRVFATVRSEFPHLQVFRTHVDLLLVASPAPLAMDPDLISRRLGEEPFVSALPNGWWVADLPGFLAYYVGGERLSQQITSRADGVVTDDRNQLEFGFARSVGRNDRLPFLELRRLAASLGESLPPGFDSALKSPGALAENRAEVYQDIRAGGDLDRDAVARFEARALVDDGRLLDGYARWRSQAGAPVTLLQALFLAEAEAEAGDPAALSGLGAFPPGREGEAAAVAARYFLRTGDRARAAQSARSALESMTRTPWGETGMMERFLNLVPEIAATDTDTLNALGRWVQMPFAGGALYEERMALWLSLAVMRGSTLDCRGPLRYFEKGPPATESYYQSRVYCAARQGGAALARAQEDLLRMKTSLPEPLTPR
jgi:predicted membrane-bound spermidine synthase